MTAVTEEMFAGVEAEDAPEFTVPDATKSRRSRREYLFPPKDKEETKSTRTTRTKRKPAPRAKKGAFVEPLTELYTTLGMMLMPFDSQCANVVMKSAEQCAQSMDELAYQNESVRRALTAITQTSAWGAVIFAHMPIIMAVVMHHGPGGMTTAMTNMFAPGNVEESTENVDG